MNFEILAGALLLVSFLSLSWLVSKKTTELKNLPPKESILPVKKIKEKIKQKATIYWKGGVPSFYAFLQKTILKLREFFIKADNKMLDLLLNLKQKTDKSRVELDDYWQDIRATLKSKDKKINQEKDKNLEEQNNLEQQEQQREDQKEEQEQDIQNQENQEK